MKHLILFLTEAIETNPEVVEEAFDFWKYVQELFTPELIATIVAMVGALSSILALIGNARKLAKTHIDSITTINKTIQDCLDGSTDKALANVVAPLTTKINKVEETEEILIKVLALMQENSPESRIAILNLLQGVGKVKDETIVEAKAKVEKQEQEAKENEEKAIKELEAIEKQEEVNGRV